MSELNERVILVPGGSGALGQAVVETLLAGGAHVASVARKPLSLEHARHFGIGADLRDGRAVGEVVGRTVERFGRLDALVHVMGGFAGGEPLKSTSDEIFERMVDMNLRGLFLTLRASIPHLERSERGRIVAVGARAGAEPAAGIAAYAASKAAVIALIKSVAGEIAESGGTANVVLPSMIDTPANRAADPEGDYAKWVKPASIAQLIGWLLSDAARDVNGAAIPIYGQS